MLVHPHMGLMCTYLHISRASDACGGCEFFACCSIAHSAYKTTFDQERNSIRLRVVRRTKQRVHVQYSRMHAYRQTQKNIREFSIVYHWRCSGRKINCDALPHQHSVQAINWIYISAFSTWAEAWSGAGIFLRVWALLICILFVAHFLSILLVSLIAGFVGWLLVTNPRSSSCGEWEAMKLNEHTNAHRQFVVRFGLTFYMLQCSVFYVHAIRPPIG